MRSWPIGKRNLKEIYRNPVLLGFLLGMPIAFMLVFIAAAGGAQASPIAMNIVDEDHSQNSSAFIQYLGSVDALKLNQPIYSEKSQAQKDLEDRRISLYLLIPSGFEAAQQSQRTINLDLVYNEADPTIGLQVKLIIETVGSQFLGVAAPLNVELTGTESKIKNPAVNFYFPGIAIYGLMILISTAAGIIAGDREKGFLSRMFTTPARPWDFILGYSLPFIPVLIISTLIYLGVGMGLGLTIVGNLGYAFLIFFLIGLCAIGIGMIVGSLVKSESQAGISWLFIVPAAMISGAWFTVDRMPSALKSIAGALPFIHAIDASRAVINGSSFSAIMLDIYWLIGWAAILFAAGITLFRRTMVS
ncbi:MAG TPA: ABC transporter permease [Dehalococcoidia bacterium]|nr:ABC transporter permease [Dehalococcoidia bacterium]